MLTLRRSLALPFGIYDGDVPVGFVMLGYDVVHGETDMPEIAKGNYCIWRFMIDEKFQGKGLGRQALQLVLDYMKTFPCGKYGSYGKYGNYGKYESYGKYGNYGKYSEKGSYFPKKNNTAKTE